MYIFPVLTEIPDGHIRPDRGTGTEVQRESPAIFCAARQRVPEGWRSDAGHLDLSHIRAPAARSHERTYRVWAGAVRGGGVRGSAWRLRVGVAARPGEPYRAPSLGRHRPRAR